MLISGSEDAWRRVHSRQRELLREWGVPEKKREEVLTILEQSPDRYGEDVDVRLFDEGDRFRAGEWELEIIHTPGHTCGHCSLLAPGRNEVFSGDALLPTYTPNIGGADVRVDRPLAQYLKTLRRLADFEFDRAWPGHREVITDPTARCRSIIEHHEERAFRVVQILNEQGPTDAWDVSRELFGELEQNHILHGPGEAYAHLDHLERRGDGVGAGYQLTDDARSRLENT